MTEVYLKKRADLRIQCGHVWVFSNEIDTQQSPLKNYEKGQEVVVKSHEGKQLGVGYINPHSLICIRLFSRETATILSQAFFFTRFKTALALREQLFSQPYYRLIFGEGDDLPGLVVDRFKHILIVQINTAGMEKQINAIKAALLQLLPETTGILLRNDHRIRTLEGLNLYVETLWGVVPPDEFIIENEVKFKVPLLSGQKTGWFYDHRVTRRALEPYVKDKRVLDVFSYLGAFGITALSYGASQVDCIEVSESASERIGENATLNNVRHKLCIITEDAFKALQHCYEKKALYDVIILDPPAFIKKAKDQKAGTIAYQRINELALKLLAPGGILVSCSCSMHMDEATLLTLIAKSAQKLKISIQLIERTHQGPDHPIKPPIKEMDYLKGLFIKRL